MKNLIEIDYSILKWAYQRNYKHTILIRALIFMGDAPFWMIIVLVAALIGQTFNELSFEHLAYKLMFGLMISNIVFGALKRNLIRKRPYADTRLQKAINLKIDNRDPGHGSKEMESFPSGHALWTTLSVSIIIFQFGYIAILLLGWMIPAMMYLRLHLGVHYPSDILAGFFIGIINAILTYCFAPVIIGFIADMKHYSYFTFGYWVFICVFLTIGFKSWLKRV